MSYDRLRNSGKNGCELSEHNYTSDQIVIGLNFVFATFGLVRCPPENETLIFSLLNFLVLLFGPLRALDQNLHLLHVLAVHVLGHEAAELRVVQVTELKKKT